jgi:small subunit ribosomal protein S4e
MARGPKKHLKRLNAPKAWQLSKLGGTWAPRPSTGPHKLRESFPLTLALRNKLKYALTRREVIMIVNRRAVQVDSKVRTDPTYPAGLMDVIRIEKTDEQFRLIYDVKGRWVLHRITKEEAKYKLLRVLKISKAKKASIGHNKFQTGQAGTIPYMVTHDGRTLKFPDPIIKVNDTIRYDLSTNKVTGHIKFDVGVLAIVTKGANVGRVGVVQKKDRHPGSFDIIHLRDKEGAEFATRIANVFVIGVATEKGTQEWISLPKAKGIKKSILEERSERNKAKLDKALKAKKKAQKSKD